MTIVLTGSTGFLGGHILERFSKNHNVLVLLRESLLASFFESNHIDIIIHCATSFSEDKIEILNSNLLYGINLLKLSIIHGVKFINLDTTSYFYKNNLYSQSKKLFRDTLIHLKFNNSLNLLIELVYGERENPNRFLPSNIQKLLADKPIKMTEGHQQRNFIHIDDLINALELIIINIDTVLKQTNEIFIASNDTKSIRELMSLLVKLTQSSSIIHYGALEYSDNDELDTVINNSFLNAIGWSQQVSLKKGLMAKIQEIKEIVDA